MENINERAGLPAWKKMFLFVGLVCIGQFYVCALIGIIRGYSVQSWAPSWIMLGGVFVLLFTFGGSFSREKNAFTKGCTIHLVSLSIIILSITSILQGRYTQEADVLSEQGKFTEAIEVYQKEIDTWYLRSKYNFNEGRCLFAIAENYCQMGEFDKGREAYQLLYERYRGHYKQRSLEEAQELDVELKNIADYQEQLGSEADDNKKSQLLFDIAIAYRRISCNEKARQQYELIQTLDVDQVFKDQAKEFAGEL